MFEHGNPAKNNIISNKLTVKPLQITKQTRINRSSIMFIHAAVKGWILCGRDIKINSYYYSIICIKLQLKLKLKLKLNVNLNAYGNKSC